MSACCKTSVDRQIRSIAYLFAVSLEDPLLKHAGGKDLEHASTFFHALFVGHNVLRRSNRGILRQPLQKQPK